MQWGDQIEFLRKTQEDTGITPYALANKPDLDQELDFYYRAYQAISRSRKYGMAGPLPIELSEILAYCSLFYINDLELRDILVRHIQNLDETYLDYLRKKHESEVKLNP